ncbi:MAG: DnaA N-terminal domain-containing protein [Pseudomonadota bacterium]
MVAKKLVGPEAGARKYDLLTALAVAGLAGSPAFSTSMTRLIALVTARYNWRLEEVSIGQAELARLWSVDLRTVKREVKRLREAGLIRVKRPGARGRVATYCLDHLRIRALTEPHWGQVGPDFALRMNIVGTSSPEPAPPPTVIPFPSRLPVPDGADDPWARAAATLQTLDPARYGAWYAPLARERLIDGTLFLRAPGRFHATYVETHFLDDLRRAVQVADPSIFNVIVRAAPE